MTHDLEAAVTRETRGPDGRRLFVEYAVDVERRDDGTIVLRSRKALGPYRARFHDDLTHWAKTAPARVFLAERVPGQEGWSTITYGEMATKARAIAASLVERGLGQDKPVLVISGNSIRHQMLLLGATMAGVVNCSTSVAYATVSKDHAKLKHILGILDPGLVFAEDAETFRAALAMPEMAGREIVVATGHEQFPGATPFDDLLRAVPGFALAARDLAIGPDTVVKVLFTSGSTGVPKGVITTHRMLCSNLQMLAEVWPVLGSEPPVWLDWLPWSHVFAGNSDVGHVLRYGGSLYLDDGRPVPGQMARTFENMRDVPITAEWNVPKAFELIAAELERDPAFRAHVFARLQFMMYAGASLGLHLWEKLERLARETTGRDIRMFTGWGLTETAPSITMLSRTDAKPGNIGLPLPGLELKLVPNSGKLEARVRGPSITPGYYKMPDATAKAFDSEGFFCTGDALAFVDPADPQEGLRFDGRVAEDFKLDTGTWVHTGDVRQRALTALGGLATDVVVTAPDRPFVGLLVFPGPGRNPADAVYRAAVREAIAAMNEATSGSSRIVARAMVMTEPASLDTGETTDKGSLNMRSVLTRRAALVERLYADAPDGDVIDLAMRRR